jgi:hypothetical protein
MAEEESGGGSLKSILIGLASTIALGVGGYVTKQLTGEEEKAEPATTVSAPAPVININQAAAQPAVVQGGTKTIIVKEKEAAPAKPKAKTAKEELEKDPQW